MSKSTIIVVTFGPFMLVPLIAVGVVLDIALKLSNSGVFTLLFAGIGVAFYALAFVLSLVILRVEKKGQERAYVILRDKGIFINLSLYIAFCEGFVI